MKILLVEDDTKISSIIKMGLEDNDCMVDVAYDSAQGERLIMNKKYDVILLDVMLPGISGFELCRKMRNNKIKTPILMLTDRKSVV